MTLTKREKIIAGGIGVVLALYVGATYVVAPYLDQRQSLNQKIQQAQDRQIHDTQLLANQPRVAAEWSALLKKQIKSQPAEAIKQVSDAIYQWGTAARLNVEGTKPDQRGQQMDDFQVIRFSLGCEGGSANAGSFLYALETTDLPIQIEKLTVSARKEGINDLNVQMTISTIAFSPSTTTRPAAKPRASAGDSL